jgi:hypothetical protein
VPASPVAAAAAAVVARNCLRCSLRCMGFPPRFRGSYLRLPDVIVGDPTKPARHSIAKARQRRPSRLAPFVAGRSSPFAPPLFREFYLAHALVGEPVPTSPEHALCVRLALWIDDLLELTQHAHARQQLRQAAVRLTLLLDRGDELAILELDAVHRHVDL